MAGRCGEAAGPKGLRTDTSHPTCGFRPGGEHRRTRRLPRYDGCRLGLAAAVPHHSTPRSPRSPRYRCRSCPWPRATIARRSSSGHGCGSCCWGGGAVETARATGADEDIAGSGMKTPVFSGAEAADLSGRTSSDVRLLRNIIRQVRGNWPTSLASAERAFELLAERPEVIERPYARALRRARGQLEFRDVWFSYRGSSTALQAISFSVPAGMRVGISGPTGVGKSTLVSLLTRLYDPLWGQILLDGIDLRDYRLADLRAQFAIVLQDSVLFSTSVAENISYGRPEAGHTEIVAAARAADVHDFIVSLPHGYDTVVGERGMRLSGGERQRIALARAFLRDAPILILDEPTSAIDVATEALIMEAMQRVMAGRTTLMIAHRLSTLEVCDARIVIEHGHLVEATGHIQMNVPEPAAFGASGQR